MPPGGGPPPRRRRRGARAPPPWRAAPRPPPGLALPCLLRLRPRGGERRVRLGELSESVLERRGGATARRLRLAHVLLERFQLRAPLQGPPRSAPGRGTAVQEHGAVRPPQRRPRPSEIGRAHV